MMSEVFARSASKVVSPRFLLVDLLPTAAVFGGVLLLIWSDAPNDRFELSRAWSTASRLGLAQVLLIGAGVVATSVLFRPLQRRLVQLLEGEMPCWLAPMSLLLRLRQQKKRASMQAKTEIHGEQEPSRAEFLKAGRAATEFKMRFPRDPTDVRATQLGNVLAAIDDRAGAEYGWDAVVAWPRLYPLLVPEVREIVDDRRDSIDAAARICVASALTAIIAVALLAGSGWWLALAAIPVVTSRIAYLGAIHTATAYGESIRSAFDLHRFDLLRALHLPLPPDRSAERAANRALSELWLQGVPTDLVYDHGPRSSDASANNHGESGETL